MSAINKVDLSLDEIIKLNRKEKRKQLILQSQKLRGGKNVPSRGNASIGRGRGSRGRYFSRQNASHGAMVFTQGQVNKTTEASSGIKPRGAQGFRRGRGRGAGRGLTRGGTSARGSRGGGGQATRGNGMSGMRSNLRGFFRSRGNLRGSFSTSIRPNLQKKRQQAMEALQEARRRLAQLDQQTARLNTVNARRGITQHAEGLSLISPSRLFSESMLSLASSAQSNVSQFSTRGRRQLNRSLVGTQVTSYNVSPQKFQRTQTQRFRGNKQPTGSTLIVSIDNTAPVRTQTQSYRRPWRRPAVPRNNKNEDLDQEAFSEKLQTLKPSTSTKYVFQTVTFSAASTGQSLNERFSSTVADDVPDESSMSRKVFL